MGKSRVSNVDPQARTGLGDIPATRPDGLDSFDLLVGMWDMEASFEAGKFGADQR